MILTIILNVLLCGYLFAYIVKRWRVISNFNTAAGNGELKITTGQICEILDKETRKFKGKKIDICLPKYEYEINGEKRFCQSFVRYRNAQIGNDVQIAFCERTGEAWAAKEITILKRSILIKTGVVAILITILWLTEMWV